MIRIVALTLACACGSTSVEASLCEVLEGETDVFVTAPLDDDKATKMQLDPHTRIEITLDSDEDVFLGFITFTPPESGSYEFGFDRDVYAELRDYNEVKTQDVPWVSTERSAPCPALVLRHTATLQTQTYHLLVDGKGEKTVTLAIAPTGDTP